MTRPISEMTWAELVDEVVRLQQRNADLAAHVERVREAEHYLYKMFDALEERPETNLAHLKAQWQAEALGHVLAEVLTAVEADTVRAHLRNAMRKLRRQAGGDV